MSGLENLTTCDRIMIISNNSLTSLQGIDNIEAATLSFLSVTGNLSLSACDVQSICNYLANPTGDIDIYNNAPGCNSPEEVQEHCLTTVKELNAEAGITIIPNPSKEEITIHVPAFSGWSLL